MNKDRIIAADNSESLEKSMELFQKIIDDLREPLRIAVLTGAGVSAESGVPTFRGKDGYWKTYRAEELATPQAFRKSPETVWEWYDYRRQTLSKLSPNDGHRALAEMEASVEDFVLITQNVDNLHGIAGSRNIIELHGNIWKSRCTSEGIVKEFTEVPLKKIPPVCSCGALLRPDIIWFGEPLNEASITGAFLKAESCNLMIVAGTSSIVYPAAHLPHAAKGSGAKVVEINLEATPLTAATDLTILGTSAFVIPGMLKVINNMV